MRPLQASFAAGELSPALYARTDLAKYAVGCRTLKNFIVHPHGGASNRPGTRYVTTTKNSGRVRLIPFSFSAEDNYVLEFGDYYVRFFKNGAPVFSGGVPYELASPWSAEELGRLTYAQSGDMVWLCGKDFNTVMTLTRRGDANWSLTAFEMRNGPFLETNTSATRITASGTTGLVTLTASAAMFSSDHESALFRLSSFVPPTSKQTAPVTSSTVFDPNRQQNFGYRRNEVVRYTLGATPNLYVCWRDQDPDDEDLVPPGWPSSPHGNWFINMGAMVGTTYEILCYNGWRFETGGFWNGNVSVQVKDPDSGVWITHRSYTSSANKNYSDSGELDEPSWVRFVASSFSQALPEGSMDFGFVKLEDFGGQYDGIVEIWSVSSPTSVTAQVKRTLPPLSEGTTDWAEGAFSFVRGFPRAVAFYQDRLAFGGTKSRPDMVWLSRPADYRNFGTSLPTADDDAISVSLSSRQVNAVRHLLSLKELMVLTVGSEWKLGGVDGIVTPSSIMGTAEGYRGSSEVDPLVVGNEILYADRRGVVRNLAYSLESDGYSGTDLTVLAEHLFRGKRVVDMAYQQAPWSVVWCALSDGSLVGLTYMREHDVVAWHRHETRGAVESLCSVPGEVEDELWLIVRRTVGGVTKRFVERLATRLPQDDPVSGVFMDCAVTKTGSASATVTGLSHLNGEAVAILADGHVLPKQVVAGGALTLPGVYSTVHVGLPYECDLETLDIDVQGDGTLLGRKKAIPSVTVRVDRTRGFWVGPDAERLDEVKFRTDEPWGAPVRLFSGDKDVQLQGGFDSRGRVFIRMRDPLPLSVLAVIPNVVAGG
jgi:hypothetical protein